MAEKYFSMSQIKGISRIETNQWNGPSEICDLYDLEKLPPADVRPVVRGRWEISCDGWYPYCPVCKEEPPGRTMTPFCPMCGADLRGR